MSFIVTNTDIKDVLLIQPGRFGDDRGWFSESWNKEKYSNAGIDLEFVQDNHSFSAKRGTVRGLHFQSPPAAQAKLIRCGRGSLLDVAVDIRVGSPTYGKWVAEQLSFTNGHQLYVPVGFAHGFITLEPDSEIIYKCSSFYTPNCEGVIQFDDPEIGIEWGIQKNQCIISDKDAAAECLSKIDNPFTYGHNP